MMRGSDFPFLIDPADVVLAVQQSLPGTVHTPEPLLAIGGLVAGLLVLIVALCTFEAFLAPGGRAQSPS